MFLWYFNLFCSPWIIPFFLSRGMICPLTILRLFSRCGQSEQSHFYENFNLKFPSKIHINTNKTQEKTTKRSKCLKNSKIHRKMIIWRDLGSRDRSERENKVRFRFQEFQILRGQERIKSFHSFRFDSLLVNLVLIWLIGLNRISNVF